MKYTGLALAACLVLATNGDGTDRAAPPPLDRTPAPSLGAGIPEPPNAPVQVGDQAPDFSWTGSDNQSHRLKDVFEQANVLMVFAPDDEVLLSLERERESLAELGVVPMALIEGRSGAIKARARRLGLHFLMIPDGRHVIASLFDVVDPQLERTQPAWFVVDRRGVVRGQWHEGLPHQGWSRIAASALALPVGDVSLPVRNH